ncbi:hypothetical protein ETAA8_39980 [Anatilimnocola aggregata]|uniref:Uncharacterized protein n=1 Tax=Anatilimnocola aggregata TaxID=2528021 RepID=A0A517YFG2_9BACT|nr:hypothetical protein [Anatilimnocola aggregata]QDU28892.1 hypothetical protein ETAA8_39980 [Anatilimnocola aggregata]
MPGRIFHFETIPILLPNHTFVTLHEHATSRWVSGLVSQYELIGRYFGIIHELGSDRYVYSKYQVHEWLVDENDTEVGHGEFIERTHNIPTLGAAKLIYDWQLPLPEHLQVVLADAMRPEPPPAPRPVEYWASRIQLGNVRSRVDDSGQPLHIEKLLGELLQSSIELVHVIRRGVTAAGNDLLRLKYVGHRLHDRFKVDSKAWVGPRDAVPPADFGWCDLPELSDAPGVRNAIDELAKLLRPYSAKLDAFMWPLQHPDRATWEEQQLLPQELKEILPELEDAVGLLKLSLSTWCEGKAEGENTPETPAQLKMPSKEDFIAHRIFVATGYDQQEIADLLLRQYSISRHRGTVSRMIERAAKWIEAGNALPDLPKPTNRPLTMDPERLNLGKNEEGRTPRQGKLERSAE